jgi:hypothetical protein
MNQPLHTIRAERDRYRKLWQRRGAKIKHVRTALKVLLMKIDRMLEEVRDDG